MKVNLKEVMKQAWKMAKYVAAKFGCSARNSLGECLKQAWENVKNSTAKKAKNIAENNTKKNRAVRFKLVSNRTYAPMSEIPFLFERKQDAIDFATKQLNICGDTQLGRWLKAWWEEKHGTFLRSGEGFGYVVKAVRI